MSGINDAHSESVGARSEGAGEEAISEQKALTTTSEENQNSCAKRKIDGEFDEHVLSSKRPDLVIGDQQIAKENKERASSSKTPHKIFALDTYCWDIILSYLSLSDKIKLAASNPHLTKLYETLQHRYSRITEIDSASIDGTELAHLLEIVNEYVISYESTLDLQSTDEQNLWLLRTYCPKVQHLKMTFRRPRWHDLKELKSLTSLHVQLNFGRAETYKDFILTLMELTLLKKLNLEAPAYKGDGLHVLENLESLEIGARPGFDGDCLAICCMKLKKLRYLNIGKYIDNLTEENFKVIVKNCHNLERFSFGDQLLDLVPYEIVCQLPKLKHVQLWHSDNLRPHFIEGLINKPGTPLESLILVGFELRVEQVDHICEIASLQELRIACENASLKGLMNLKNLKILDLNMPDLTNNQLLALLEGLPLLTVLGVRKCKLITSEFVSQATRLYNCRKIKIYLQVSANDWHKLRISNDSKSLQFQRGYLSYPY
ncbi:uncharacterized protein LOC108110841 [Drosophila eugracilis]|uniref:uncharacterized protein LOC108110841 n=1 Tax=Drosophila eugracilis TaxID=29029 RepID=UPI001BD9D9B7|nr:uncharacterized protein LOC108110841 [Drosophila eugracilis]